MPANAVAADPQNPTHWYVGTDLGVYVSTNQGVAWEPFGMGLPNAVVTDLQIHDSDRKLIVATYGRGAWVTDLNTATAAPPSVAQPLNLMLDPPSPNPSAGQTMLRFAAKGSGDATLDVYNAAGRRVDSLGTFRADGVVRMISWQPQQTAAGVYYAVLRSGTEKVTRKIVFAR